MESKKVSIELSNNVYERFQSLPYTLANAFAEFIDNSIQSARNNYELLKELDPDFKLKILIFYNNDENSEQEGLVLITDNSAGMDEKTFQTAFIPGHKPDNDAGLSEFGMGMKTAAFWLGNNWNVTSRSIVEDIKRTISFDLKEIIANDLKEVEFKEEPANDSWHGTTIWIKEPSQNVPKKTVVARLRKEIASIYRDFLRSGEVEIFINNEFVHFDEYEVLESPFVRNPKSTSVVWKKEVGYEVKDEGYKLKGFVGILKEMDSKKNGFVIKRRGRVIIGASDTGRYFPETICGSTGSPRYKRVFGELEVEGFNVSFSKDALQNQDILESMLLFIKDQIHNPDFDLLTQAEEYRLESKQKTIEKVVKHFTTAKKKNDNKPTAVIPVIQPEEVPNLFEDVVTVTPQKHEDAKGEFDDVYTIGDRKINMKVMFFEKGEEEPLFSIAQPKDDDENYIECNINTMHPYFNHFDKSLSKEVVTIIKSMAIAKVYIKLENIDGTNNFFKYFESLMRNTKS